MISSDSDPIYSLLYIDDEENNLVSFKSTFRREYHIHVASSGQEALEIMENHNIQLVITGKGYMWFGTNSRTRLAYEA